MNILHIYSSFEMNQGGPPVSIKNLSLSQNLFGNKVSIMTFCKKKPIISGVKIIKVNYLFKRFSIPNLKSLIELRKYILNSDIVHLHGMWNGLISIAAFLARKKITVITPHGMSVKRNIYNKPLFKKIYFNMLDKFAFKKINGCHYLNLHEYKNSKWLFGNRNKYVKHNLIDTEHIHDYLKKNNNKKIFDNKFINLVYLGRFNEIKNIIFQIKLVRELIKKNKNVILYLFGPNNSHKSYLINIVKEYKLEKNIKFKKAIFGEKKFLLLKMADCVLLTSNYECNSILALETIAAGGLLISNKNCNLDDFYNRRTCVLGKNNINDFAKIILKCRNFKYKNIRKNAMQFAKLNLNYKIKDNSITEFYGYLLKNV